MSTLLIQANEREKFNKCTKVRKKVSSSRKWGDAIVIKTAKAKDRTGGRVLCDVVTEAQQESSGVQGSSSCSTPGCGIKASSQLQRWVFFCPTAIPSKSSARR